jgi:hypothetical protein
MIQHTALLKIRYPIVQSNWDGVSKYWKMVLLGDSFLKKIKKKVKMCFYFLIKKEN